MKPRMNIRDIPHQDKMIFDFNVDVNQGRIVLFLIYIKCVQPSNGYGTEFMKGFIRWAGAIGVNSITLEVVEEGVTKFGRLVRWYESLGFCRTGGDRLHVLSD